MAVGTGGRASHPRSHWESKRSLGNLLKLLGISFWLLSLYFFVNVFYMFFSLRSIFTGIVRIITYMLTASVIVVLLVWSSQYIVECDSG